MTKGAFFVNAKLTTEQNIVDFIAVKIGDVNNSVVAGVNGAATTRSNETLVLEVEQAKLQAGQTYKMNVRSSNFTNINGYQFTMNFDQSALEFAGVSAGALAITESNFGLNKVSQGIITTSWNSNNAISVTNTEVLFTVEFVAKNNVDLTKSIAITSDVTKAEAYNSGLQSMNIELAGRSNAGVAETSIFELYQNTPNPFAKETVIEFRLPEAAPATLTIYDVTGKVHLIQTIEGQKGLNSIQIDRNKLSGVGMFYYQLDANTHTATKRMLIIE